MNKIILTLLALTMGTFAQQKFTNGIVLTQFTVAILPSAAGHNKELVLVTDGTSSGDCAVGGGSTFALCQSNGSVWIAAGGGGGSSVTHSMGNVSGTITFPAATSTTSDYYSLTLTGTGTSSTISGLSPGETVTIHACENGTGSFALALPTGFPASVDMTKAGANVCVNQVFVWDGAVAHYIGGTVESGPPIGGNCIQTAGQGYFAPWGLSPNANAATAYAANSLTMWEFYVPCQITINKLDTLIQTGDNAKHIAFAIYNAAAGVIVANGTCATMTSNGAANQAVTCAFPAAVTLPVGTYMMAYTTDSAATLKMYVSIFSGTVFGLTLNVLETTTNSRNFSCSNSAAWSGSAPNFPASCGTRTVLGTTEPAEPPWVLGLP
jgi:hypothetical protein